MNVRIAPSILSADFGRLAEQIVMCEAGGADLIHVDVMDGRFVPNLTFGAKVIEVVRKSTKLPVDVHLMVENPENFIKPFAASGADILTVHTEATPHLDRLLTHIKEMGCEAGVALNPATSLSQISEVVHLLDLLLVMTVNPGFGGQKFIDYTVGKIARARRLLDECNSSASLEVDGGINRETITRCWRAGADTFVAGNAIFSAPSLVVEIGELRYACGVTA